MSNVYLFVSSSHDSTWAGFGPVLDKYITTDPNWNLGITAIAKSKMWSEAKLYGTLCIYKCTHISETYYDAHKCTKDTRITRPIQIQSVFHFN